MHAKKRTLLIIDRDKILVQFLTEEFTKKKWDVRSTTSVTNAKKVYARKIPNVLVIDDAEPEADVFMREWRVSKKTGAIPIVVLTEGLSHDRLITHLGRGAKVYLKGQISLASLTRVIEGCATSQIKS